MAKPGLSLLKGALCVIVSVLRLSVESVKGGGYVKYGTEAKVVPGKLNVHLVPHSHDDVGWLKTVDQYYVGSNNSIQNACVRNVLDSVVDSLLGDPNRKFVFAEMAFFTRWWEEQSPETQEQVKRLVKSGQLEFVNGGWAMNDEATCHYIDMIDQTTKGHRFIKQQFNTTPRAAWQIDPFGHSSVQAYLLGAELGLDSVHFARIDYQDREKRKAEKSLEVIWRGSKTLASSSQIFTNVFLVHYGPPTGFHYEVTDDYVPLQDNPRFDAYNIKEAVDNFVNASLVYANVSRGNHVMWTMGDDFQYQFAESWFRQMDRLIHYVNKDGRVNALYSTPSLYVDAKNDANVTWPLKTGDFFPYADRAYAYWTGYFTSRPALKRYVRALSGYYMAARQLEFRVGKKSGGPNTCSLGDALAIAQHHDAVTGTAKQHVTNDYMKRLAVGASEAEAVVNAALACLLNKAPKGGCTKPAIAFSQCSLMNISYCPSTEETIPSQKSLILVAYNSLGWNRTEIIRIPVNDAGLSVEDSSGKTLDAQYIPMDNVTSNLRSFYTKAYLGISSLQIPKYWLVFKATVPPLGWNTFFISKASAQGSSNHTHSSVMLSPVKNTTEIGPGNVKMVFSSDSGRLERIYNSRTGADIMVDQNYFWYASNGGDAKDPQVSGAYIFRPNGSLAYPVSSSKPKLQIVRGPLIDEVHQQFSPWVAQVVRLYKEKEHAEFEFTIGPIPSGNGDLIGKEIITRMVTNMTTDKAFYTDSNGRDFLKRVRDNRTDWHLQVNEPIAGNYYPLNLGMYSKDEKAELSVLVDRATGGASIKNGEIELMLHRSTCMDDARGVEEGLAETVCVNGTCAGLTVRGNYYVSINRIGEGGRWRRETGQELYSPLLMAFAHENKEKWKASNTVKGYAMDPLYTLPQNTALITLEGMDFGNVLVRLAHLYEAGEDSDYSKTAKVELKKLFSGKMIKEVTEMSLSGNQEKAKMKEKMKWKVEGEAEEASSPQRGGAVDKSTLVVELGPMEIRTFVVEFSQKQRRRRKLFVG
ncbi:probable alpha-mannosidase At5g66150 isoform X1 [Arabidopsis lyrata subsp. lyrata]|uniref:probable alpha-mannosidase At5g66150 isoform X1 n=2 Tax=Arabidopsis lyrata subsp. lyrata TaxID=81972 RepID=UPI000A29A57A|nr:probable alpha-mannosidase At5g66150 isoform X1 [Arabidopsis lyrata subsp. lyrata]|eukprot:XP_020878111.1 probable alpha-mannosidase At5g66150 isoform X1 [Arabidopsis lyrata subsp. lyrata]